MNYALEVDGIFMIEVSSVHIPDKDMCITAINPAIRYIDYKDDLLITWWGRWDKPGPKYTTATVVRGPSDILTTMLLRLPNHIISKYRYHDETPDIMV